MKLEAVLNPLKKVFYQSDSLIAKLFLDCSVSTIVSNDSDFVMCLGGTSIQIKDFDYDTKSKKTSTITSSFCSN